MFPWYEATLLAIEANAVIALRLAKLSRGGWDGYHEAQQMVSEKVFAAMEATQMTLRGDPQLAVITRYRDHVGANTIRLREGR